MWRWQQLGLEIEFVRLDVTVEDNICQRKLRIISEAMN
jgi:hypothetical protein